MFISVPVCIVLVPVWLKHCTPERLLENELVLAAVIEFVQNQKDLVRYWFLHFAQVI